MVHRPDLELRRLTPSNHDELLFDDVLWVRKARQQHDAFVDQMRDRGVEVYYLVPERKPRFSRWGYFCCHFDRREKSVNPIC